MNPHFQDKVLIMNSSDIRNRLILAVTLASSISMMLTSPSLADDPSANKKITKLFLTSGQVDLAREIIRLPLHQGKLLTGEIVWFVLTDVSDEATSNQMG